MTYLIEFGDTTQPETFETMPDWLDDYVINHLQYGEDFETEKQRFIDNQITEIN